VPDLARGWEEDAVVALQEARSWNGAQSVIRGLAARLARQSIKQLISERRKVSTATSGYICFRNPSVTAVSITCSNFSFTSRSVFLWSVGL
jgi:hypothetical protein